MLKVWLFIVAAVALAVLLFYGVAGIHDGQTEKTQQESPCESCLRWSECNGVDKDCPLRKVLEHEQD